MLSRLLFSLRDVFGAFNVFQYITFRSAFGALVAFGICYITMPSWIAFLRRRGIGQVVRTDGPQSHQPKAGTPTMGGVVLLIVIALSTTLWAWPDRPLVWLILVALLWFGGIGVVDDLKKVRSQYHRGLSPTSKLLWQSLGAVGITLIYLLRAPQGVQEASILSLPFLKYPVYIPTAVYVLLACIVMVGTTNAVNLTDGLDGLAAGCMALTGTGLGVMAYLAGNKIFSTYLRIVHIPEAGEVAVVCAILVGACLGFLWYNAYPAQIFMGDVGSLGLGGMLGAVAVFIKAELLLVIFGGVFVLEALSVLAQVGFYKLKKKRILLMAPLHHHFELRGLPESKVIVRFWIFSILLIVGMLCTLKLR